MAQLSDTALCILRESSLVSTPTGVRGRSGRCYSKRVSDPLFRAGYLSTTLFSLFTGGIRVTAAGRKAVTDHAIAIVDDLVAAQDKRAVDAANPEPRTNI